MIAILAEKNDVICNGAAEKLIILKHCTDPPAYLKIIRVGLQYAKGSDCPFVRNMDPKDKFHQR